MTNRRRNLPYLRASVKSWDEMTIRINTSGESNEEQIVDYGEMGYLRDILKPNMQINLLNTSRGKDGHLRPELIVVCPDYLLDISAIAVCFKEYGHHPLNYFIKKIEPKVSRWQILLGNLASQFLDDYVNESDDNPVNYSNTLKRFFASSALEFCTCDIPADFHDQAKRQMNNIRLTVHKQLPHNIKEFDRSKTLLEASFICEKLGLQGRVDMLQSDMKILIEQKSGKRDEYRGWHKEDHFVQMLLYQGILEQNFGKETDGLRSFLFYSRYPDGLMAEHFVDTLFHESIKVRNQIVAQELAFGEGGIEDVVKKISTDQLNERKQSGKLWKNYQEPVLQAIIDVVQQCSPIEQAYFERFFTFLSKEMIISKTGGNADSLYGFSGTWHLSLKEKIENGDIICGLTIKTVENDETISFDIPCLDEGYMPNFRKGDIVMLYPYKDTPDARTEILMKGNIAEINSDRVTVKLRNKRHNDFAPQTIFAIEHDSSDITFRLSFRGLYTMLTANKDRRDLLLGQRMPETDETRILNGEYGEFDELILRMKRCKDYYLLAGPPGTGKTSCALRHMVEETLTEGDGSILLLSFTNRAVDEICDMLVNSGIADRHRFIRIGSELSCDQRFTPYLLSNSLEDCPKLSDMKKRIKETRIFVATTTTINNRVNMFRIKRFDVAFIDESSQILEPDIIGILSAKAGEQNAIGKFVMIGDYKQLPAITQQSADDAKVDNPMLNEIGLTDCRNSLFERLYRQCPKEMKGVLRKQGRMHPAISAFPCEAFYTSENLMPVPLNHQKIDSTIYDTEFAEETLLRHRMIFIPVGTPDGDSTSDKINKGEAKVVAMMLERIHRLTNERFNANKTVGVIVPYRNQITMIRKEIAKTNISELNDISIDTVERYQGSQRDTIIFSFTISKPYQLDFLTANTFIEDGRAIDRKLNVALTRARKQLILTGNPEILSINPLFKRLIDHIRSQGGWLDLFQNTVHLTENIIPCGSHNDTHQGADIVENTVGQISQSRHT